MYSTRSNVLSIATTMRAGRLADFVPVGAIVSLLHQNIMTASGAEKPTGQGVPGALPDAEA